MDTKHAGFEEAEQYTCAHLKTLCSETRFDAVVAGDDAALHFAMNLSGKRVLLVEDNYLNAEIATLMLKEKDILVSLAENGKAGAEAFAASAPGAFDAILMDIRMTSATDRSPPMWMTCWEQSVSRFRRIESAAFSSS